MTKIEIKPLSVNRAWQGRRYKTDDYERYERDVSLLLPKEIPYGKHLHIEFGFNSRASDLDNPVKPFLDILQKKYGFNDNAIEKLTLVKKIVPRGQEYIDFHFE